MRTMFSRSTIQVWTSACEVWLWTYRMQRVRFLGPSGLQSAEHALLDLPRRPRRVDAGRSQSALRRHLAQAQRGRRAPPLRGHLLRPRRHGKRIKECRLDLYADRTSAATRCANQMRLWFASMAYILLCALRRIGLAETALADATCGTIRLKLLKIGARVRVSVRRIRIAMASDDRGRAAKRPAPRWTDTRRRGAAHARHHPQAHRDPINAQPRKAPFGATNSYRLRPANRNQLATCFVDP